MYAAQVKYLATVLDSIEAEAIHTRGSIPYEEAIDILIKDRRDRNILSVDEAKALTFLVELGR